MSPRRAQYQHGLTDQPTVSRNVTPTLNRTELCRQQAKVIQNLENANVRNTAQGQAMYRSYKWLKFGVGQAYDRSSDCRYNIG